MIFNSRKKTECRKVTFFLWSVVSLNFISHIIFYILIQHRISLYTCNIYWFLDFWIKIEKKYTKIIYKQDVFTVQKGHNKRTVVQKEAHWSPFLVLILNSVMWLYDKNILDKIHVTVSNILKLMHMLLLINFTFIKTRLLGEHIHVDQATRQFSCTCISSRYSVCRNVAFVLSLSVYIRIYMSTTLVLWTVYVSAAQSFLSYDNPWMGTLSEARYRFNSLDAIFRIVWQEKIYCCGICYSRVEVNNHITSFQSCSETEDHCANSWWISWARILK